MSKDYPSLYLTVWPTHTPQRTLNSDHGHLTPEALAAAMMCLASLACALIDKHRDGQQSILKTLRLGGDVNLEILKTSPRDSSVMNLSFTSSAFSSREHSHALAMKRLPGVQNPFAAENPLSLSCEFRLHYNKWRRFKLNRFMIHAPKPLDSQDCVHRNARGYIE